MTHNLNQGTQANPVTTVLLDVDGTLLDSNDAHTQAWKNALASFGYHFPYDRLRPLIGKGSDKLLAEVAGIELALSGKRSSTPACLNRLFNSSPLADDATTS